MSQVLNFRVITGVPAGQRNTNLILAARPEWNEVIATWMPCRSPNDYTIKSAWQYFQLFLEYNPQIVDVEVFEMWNLAAVNRRFQAQLQKQIDAPGSQYGDLVHAARKGCSTFRSRIVDGVFIPDGEAAHGLFETPHEYTIAGMGPAKLSLNGLSVFEADAEAVSEYWPLHFVEATA